MKKIFNVDNANIATTIEYDFRFNGPKASNNPNWSPRLMYKDDWSDKYDVLWLRPNNSTFNTEDKEVKLLDHESIIEFVENVHTSGKLAFTILTQNADDSPDPNAVRIIYRDNGISIRTSVHCKPTDIDSETGILIQKILDVLGGKTRFDDIFDEWSQKWKALNNDDRRHSVAEMILNRII